MNKTIDFQGVSYDVDYNDDLVITSICDELEEIDLNSAIAKALQIELVDQLESENQEYIFGGQNENS